ncbi:unnamed protein product [Schistocephalus solidus]|uniref:5'-3' exoribonuclease 1 SH3-like domain-containing protein n=1 Tax=Schistocephalus solidus TaxID=70667 RepID=A0A3P7F1R2_SCHSO|nr:unnamed protein product [Schistocephalus solidus]
MKDFLRTEVWTQKVVSTADAEWVEQNGFKIIESSLPVISTEVAGAKSEPILIRASNVVAAQAVPSTSARFRLCHDTAPRWHLPSGDVLVPDQYLDWLKTVKKKLYVFHLLDRVIYVGPSGELFGHFGVIVGCYSVNGVSHVSSTGEERLEVLFDKSFLGAKSIRCVFCWPLLIGP